jgi:PAS domain S-box-containing protein
MQARDEHKTREQLIDELKRLRARVAELEKVEEMLRRIEQEKAIILDSILEHLVYQDTEMRVLWANKTTIKSVGLSPELLIGRYCYEIWHQRDEPCVGCPVVKALKTGQPQIGEVRHSNEEILLIRGYPVRNAKGELVGVLEAALNITKRKRAEEKLRSLASELSLAEERERRRIATDLHDYIGQTLAISKIKLERLRESVYSVDLAVSLGEIQKLIDQAIQYTRSLTFELSPPILYELGFEAAVEWLSERILKKHSILFELEDDGKPKPMDEEILITLFKAVRELLFNIIKHAQARNVKISIRRENDDIRIEVEDDGVGFDTSLMDLNSGGTTGFGLFNIRERLSYLGGHLEIKSEPGRGTRIAMTAPLRGEG